MPLPPGNSRAQSGGRAANDEDGAEAPVTALKISDARESEFAESKCHIQTAGR
jgi:hypothetical protein